MPFVSITRLRLRSARFLPGFFYWAIASNRQARHTPGFLGGWTGNEGAFTYWTATCWRDEAAMRSFRASGAHLRAMPKLLHWCDMASVAHWEQADAAVPSADGALRALEASGRLSKVQRPSPEQQDGRLALGVAPRASQRLLPAP